MDAPPGTTALSDRHRFDCAAVAGFLERKLPGFRGPVSVRQFAAGQSNPTFHLAAQDGEYVLRKKPPGTLLPSAHAIDREFRVLSALAGSDVPVPRTRLYCNDAAIAGTPFYVMDYVPGRIFDEPLLPGLAPAERGGIYDGMNAALAALHAFDWAGAGLADFGKPERYVERQIARWSRQYAATRTDDVPAMDKLQQWLRAHVPRNEVTTLVHGDFRLGNLIFHPREPRVVAILDWELSTLGHPFADLAYSCMSFHVPAGDDMAAGLAGADLVMLGIPAEGEYVADYARRSGRDPFADYAFFVAFSLFRVAAIQQGVYARSLAGNAASNSAARFKESYRRSAETGWDFVATH
ncbi:MAG: phosphotransferase family protein [Betaproteobacteria bacterium]|nr:phosphotransferase family protein [Betaproteobacteria bacterium]